MAIMVGREASPTELEARGASRKAEGASAFVAAPLSVRAEAQGSFVRISREEVELKREAYSLRIEELKGLREDAKRLALGREQVGLAQLNAEITYLKRLHADGLARRQQLELELGLSCGWKGGEELQSILRFVVDTEGRERFPRALLESARLKSYFLHQLREVVASFVGVSPALCCAQVFPALLVFHARLASVEIDLERRMAFGMQLSKSNKLLEMLGRCIDRVADEYRFGADAPPHIHQLLPCGLAKAQVTCDFLDGSMVRLPRTLKSSGLVLGYERETLVVAHVQRGSFGVRAGILEGDEILWAGDVVIPEISERKALAILEEARPLNIYLIRPGAKAPLPPVIAAEVDSSSRQWEVAEAWSAAGVSRSAAARFAAEMTAALSAPPRARAAANSLEAPSPQVRGEASDLLENASSRMAMTRPLLAADAAANLMEAAAELERIEVEDPRRQLFDSGGVQIELILDRREKMGFAVSGGPPKSRVVLQEVEDLTWGSKQGLRRGDELVNLDGAFVHRMTKLGFSRALNVRPLRMMFWRPHESMQVQRPEEQRGRGKLTGRSLYTRELELYMIDHIVLRFSFEHSGGCPVLSRPTGLLEDSALGSGGKPAVIVEVNFVQVWFQFTTLKATLKQRPLHLAFGVPADTRRATTQIQRLFRRTKLRHYQAMLVKKVPALAKANAEERLRIEREREAVIAIMFEKLKFDEIDHELVRKRLHDCLLLFTGVHMKVYLFNCDGCIVAEVTTKQHALEAIVSSCAKQELRVLRCPGRTFPKGDLVEKVLEFKVERLQLELRNRASHLGFQVLDSHKCPPRPLRLGVAEAWAAEQGLQKYDELLEVNRQVAAEMGSGSIEEALSKRPVLLLFVLSGDEYLRKKQQEEEQVALQARREQIERMRLAQEAEDRRLHQLEEERLAKIERMRREDLAKIERMRRKEEERLHAIEEEERKRQKRRLEEEAIAAVVEERQRQKIRLEEEAIRAEAEKRAAETDSAALLAAEIAMAREGVAQDRAALKERDAADKRPAENMTAAKLAAETTTRTRKDKSAAEEGSGARKSRVEKEAAGKLASKTAAATGRVEEDKSAAEAAAVTHTSAAGREVASKVSIPKDKVEEKEEEGVIVLVFERLSIEEVDNAKVREILHSYFRRVGSHPMKVYLFPFGELSLFVEVIGPRSCIQAISDAVADDSIEVLGEKAYQIPIDTLKKKGVAPFLAERAHLTAPKGVDELGWEISKPPKPINILKVKEDATSWAFTQGLRKHDELLEIDDNVAAEMTSSELRAALKRRPLKLYFLLWSEELSESEDEGAKEEKEALLRVRVEKDVGDQLGMKYSRDLGEIAVVTNLSDGGWAQVHGVTIGDELVEVNGKAVESMASKAELKEALAKRPADVAFRQRKEGDISSQKAQASKKNLAVTTDTQTLARTASKAGSAAETDAGWDNPLARASSTALNFLGQRLSVAVASKPENVLADEGKKKKKKKHAEDDRSAAQRLSAFFDTGFLGQ